MKTKDFVSKHLDLCFYLVQKKFPHEIIYEISLSQGLEKKEEKHGGWDKMLIDLRGDAGELCSVSQANNVNQGR